MTISRFSIYQSIIKISKLYRFFILLLLFILIIPNSPITTAYPIDSKPRGFYIDRIKKIDRPTSYSTQSFGSANQTISINQTIKPIYEGELNTYQAKGITEIYQDDSATLQVIASKTDEQGNIYLLGNYPFYPHNESISLHYLIDYPFTFVNGINSTNAGFFMKFLADGTFENGINLDYDDEFDYSFISMEIDNFGNYYFLAERTYIGSGSFANGTDVAIFKYDSYLNLLATKIISDQNQIGFGIDVALDEDDQPFADLLELDSQGNVIVVGNSSNGLDKSAFVLKLDSNLNMMWSRNLTVLNNSGRIFVSSLALDSQDNIYLSGLTEIPFADLGASTPYQIANYASGTGYISSFNSNGNYISTTTFGGASTDFIYDIEIDRDDNLRLAGKMRSINLTLSVLNSKQVLTPSNGSAFVTRLNPSNWEILSHQRIGDTQVRVDNSTIYDIEIVNGSTFFYGYYIDNGNSVGFARRGIFYQQFSLSWGVPTRMIGIINSTDNLVLATLNPIGQIWWTKYTPFVVNPISWEITIIDYTYTTYVTTAYLSFIPYSITDTDNDGLSDYNEEFVYGSSANSNDTDGDGLFDPIEVYTYFTDPNSDDSDKDCLKDLWELEYGFDPTFPDTSADTDGDGLTNFEELEAGTDATLVDTDNDTLSDYDEVMIYRTNASSTDTDNDGLSDPNEILIIGTDPLNNDTDGDRLLDYFEYNYLLIYVDGDGNSLNGTLNPINQDTDGDLLDDNIELFSLGTMPFEPDSDFDGISDYDERYAYNTNPLIIDTDGDNLNDSYEIFISFTNPNATDSDFDGLNDFDEIFIYQTDPNLNDTDFDNLNDSFEVLVYLSDPLLYDSDADGLSDFQEFNFGSNSTKPDTDDDLLPDWWEYEYQLNPIVNDSAADPDADNLTTLMEYYNGTHPTNADPDNDSLNDLTELKLGTDPWYFDSDNDTLSDGDEVNRFDTSPLFWDSDRDGLSDAEELFIYSSNPLSYDTDNDSISDFDEVITYNTNVTSNDTDNDQISDFNEIKIYQTNPISNDTDADGLTDYEEIFIYLTDPLKLDSDFDGLSDGDEIKYKTDPFNIDTDSDGLIDGFEIELNTNPLLNDTDADGLSDYTEIQLLKSNPNNNDTDADGMPDGWEAQFNLNLNSDDAASDPDRDGLTNIQEYKLGTDPKNDDTDSDGITDGDEIDQGLNPLDPEDGKSESSFGEQVGDAVKQDPLMSTGVIVSLSLSIFIGTRSKIAGKSKLGGT